MFTDENWLEDSRELDRLIAEARRQRAEAVAHYMKLAFSQAKARMAAFLAPFREWRERAALESELRGMSEVELRDIGISRSEIDSVVNGSFRDERGTRLRRRPILVRLDPGQRRIPATEPIEKPKAA